MREVRFLRQNSEKWKEFDRLLKDDQDEADPNRLTDLFVELTDDLSYAQTYYPQSATTSYLNALSAKVHQRLYRNRVEQRSRFIQFWTREIPVAIRTAHRAMIISLVVVLTAAGLGIMSMHYDSRFARLVLGNGYVNMTEQNIKNGEPMAVYNRSDGWNMFLHIAINNEMVAVRMFLLGALFSLGTIAMLFRNGMMVGVFQYFFAQHDVLEQSARGIWVHGTLEISAMVIAGAAGIILGNSILFPGTYTRLESFKNGAQLGMKILIGLVPQILVAAAIESYITRFSSMAPLLCWMIIAASFIGVLWYYVYYPLQLEKSMRRVKEGSSSL